VPAFEFLFLPMPRRWLVFDVVTNVLGYAPLGFLTVLAVHPAVRGVPAVTLAALCCAALSFLLETLQTYLPSRTPSNVDFYANALGGALGALAALALGARLLRDDTLHALRYRLFRGGRAIDIGLVLLGLWLVTQLNPETLLFGNGDLRDLLDSAPPGEHYAPGLFIRVEAFVAGANVAAVGLLVALLARDPLHARALFLVLVVGALAMRTLAYAVYFKLPNMMLWLTPGAMIGAAAGILLVVVASRLPGWLQLALCGVGLMAATVVVNVAPTNPYLAESLSTWQAGQLFNFNGLTRLVSQAWPFMAIAYAFVLSAARGRRSG
jgi:hypothetical protein